MYCKDKDGNPHQGPIPAHHLTKLLAEGGSKISYEEFTAIQVAMNTPPAKTFDELLSDAGCAINEWRTAQENGGILFNGTVFDTDEAAYKRIAAVVLAGANPLGYWTSAANVDVPMTYDDVKALYDAITLAGAEIHARQRAMKLALLNMTDAELQAFVPGWDVAPNWLPQ
jgi:hypothetical protein